MFIHYQSQYYKMGDHVLRLAVEPLHLARLLQGYDMVLKMSRESLRKEYI